ncbi:MAG TPA: HlyD family efflux transporter periplasmic adaptor subunit [Acetobacteraceae bacterium]|nr:HlyD family efflux transporter periplasmic adaptor subunit [Acetobacteraceae bacterium]
MSEQLLFRRESLQYHYGARFGRPAISLGLPVTISTIVSLALAVGLAALIAFGSYTRRVDLNGVVLPATGLFSVASPSSGWVSNLAVKEGDRVAQGALLYTIDVDTAIKQGSVQQTITAALINQRALLQNEVQRQIDLAGETQKQLQEKITNLKAQQDQLDRQQATQESFEARLRNEYTLFLQHFAKHTVTANDMDAREQAWMSARSALDQTKVARLRVAAALADAEYQQTTDPITSGNEIDILKGRIAVLSQDLANSESHHSIEIRAPGAGIVTAIAAHPGQVVSTGARVLTIVPTTVAMQADLLAPSAAIGFVRAGERVLLRYSAFPYQKFGQFWGTVTSVSRAALLDPEVQQRRTASKPAQGSGMYYEVTVQPDQQKIDVMGEQRPLPADMQVNAYVLLDRRPIYQWILEPLYTVERAVRAR